jgi:hypothetical protein
MNKHLVFFTFCAICIMFNSGCALHSTTYIKANDAFVLGNNKHGSFRASLKNISKHPITVHEAPIDGGKHSETTVQPNQKVSVKVDRNTALIVTNASNTEAAVQLKVTGDTGLSMGYKK